MPEIRDALRSLDIVLGEGICQMFEHIPDLHFFIKDRDRKLIYCNETHRRGILRFSEADEVYGKDNTQFFPNVLAETFTEDDKAVIEKGESIYERIELNISGTGAIRWFCTTKVPARDRRGQIQGLIGISRPIDDADHVPSELAVLLPAIQFIQNNRQAPIRISTLAEACGLTELNFRREFKNVFRISPLQFILRCRIQLACLQLEKTKDSVADVAANCGFEDQNYFARQFRRIMGVTPSQFRSRLSLTSSE
ncbi:helix-turn-helix transcriptional regulator [Bremerella sp. P1]|uniref:helix-turn-helix transcriptional regulator n=1 Tax=Bremerella sp. P1 TaxID=3026424 RepID=UPI002368DA3B|nr:AraC family transcriptional regulator [Bremerella sp. P1]WDI42637.1 AraC family transcriptional regulator [Bremerella sp. P1]